MLQTRNGKRTGLAAVHIAVDMVEEGILTQKEAVAQGRAAVARPAPAPDLRPQGAGQGRGRGQGPARLAGRGHGRRRLHRRRRGGLAAEGQARRARAHGDGAGRHPRHERGPGHPHRHRRHDVPRGRGRPPDGQAVRGRLRRAGHRRQGARRSRSAGQTLKEGDRISIDGSTGEVILQELPTSPSEVLQVVTGTLKAGEVAAVPEVREAAGLGGRDPAPGHPRQRGHPARRQGRLRLRRARHRPVPHRAHVLRGGPAAATS